MISIYVISVILIIGIIIFVFNLINFRKSQQDLLYYDESKIVEISMANFISESYVNFETGNNAYVKKENSEDFLKLNEGDIVNEGDIIEVRENTILVINWPDKSITRLNENSQMQINQLIIDKENPEKTNIVINILDGNIWSKTMNMMTEDSKFEIETSDIIAGVLGTTFNVSVNKDTGCIIISTIEHAINLKLEDDEILYKGKEILLNCNGYDEKKIQDIEKNSWIDRNQNLDKIYDEKIKRDLKDTLNNILHNKDENIQFLENKLKIEKNDINKAKTLLELIKFHLFSALQEMDKGQKQISRENIQKYNLYRAELMDLLSKIEDIEEVEKLKTEFHRILKLWLKYKNYFEVIDLNIENEIYNLNDDYMNFLLHRERLLKLIEEGNLNEESLKILLELNDEKLNQLINKLLENLDFEKYKSDDDEEDDDDTNDNDNDNYRSPANQNVNATPELNQNTNSQTPPTDPNIEKYNNLKSELLGISISPSSIGRLITLYNESLNLTEPYKSELLLIARNKANEIRTYINNQITQKENLINVKKQILAQGVSPELREEDQNEINALQAEINILKDQLNQLSAIK